ncbi:hypothetical protein EJ08DRAFT_731278 [Tothia fuscella]|uniref:Anucleate primary sterigmata protein B n=1 Tax=Tothia fuscella TaxID=1048955 RepID=A0A9P4NY00_9PEZI|nr:hypothetical protein EJ08DRAFT_731278 [Tothia fuscella]
MAALEGSPPAAPSLENNNSPEQTTPKKEGMDADNHAGERENLDAHASMQEIKQEEREDIHTFEVPDSDLPPLPMDSDEDLSLMEDGPSDAGNSDTSTLLERDMRRNLLDMESSFLADASTTSARGATGPVGADDTFLFGGSPGNTKKGLVDSFAKNNTIEEEKENYTDAVERRATRSPTTPPSSYKTPFRTAAEAGADSSTDIGTLPSSPMEAAAQRKAIALDGTGGQDTVDSEPLSNEGTAETVVRHGHQRVSSHTSTIKSDSLDDINIPDSASDGTVGSLHSPRPSMASSRLFKRPSFTHRTSSQRSSVSSITGRSVTSDASDITVGADYALQSGGGVAPSSGLLPSRPSLSLSRLPSMGSIGSAMNSSYSDSEPSWNRSRSTTGALGDRTLERLEEERAHAGSPPETPRPGTSGGLVPTDTVVAHHVQNIRVPETVAREFREKHLLPARSSTAPLSLSRAKSNLTLKEQNSKIDKLSKENFDLKLKIHFLDQALQNRSEAGMQDIINKNVQLQTDLAHERKESQSLRKKMRDLEKKLKAQEDGQSKAVGSDDENSDGSQRQAEMEEEIIYLKEMWEESQRENENLKTEIFNKETDKRRLGDYVRQMGENRSSEPTSSGEDNVDMWKELLETETARREQADEDAEKLREEIRRLRSEAATITTTNHVRNTYNVNKRHNVYGNRSDAGGSVAHEDVNGTVDSNATTVVDALKHENAELRRDLSAQTSMLTSRNRERERLQQEIEDLKINHRRHGDVRSVAGDSIFERSVSRAHNHNRAESRASGNTRVTQLSDGEREDYEKRTASLRDDLAKIRIINQDLERELNAHLDILQRSEEENAKFKEQKVIDDEDIQGLAAERDEALLVVQDKEEEIEALRQEAMEELDNVDQQLAQKEQDFDALQKEMKIVSERVVRLEDELEASRRQEEQLEQQLEDNERELERTDQKLRDTVEKNERLEVQLESSQSEIAFLREEQEGDKIKIGDIEAALNHAQSSLEDERERIAEDRRQREILDSQEKADVQHMIDGLNAEGAQFKDEIRKLRENLAAKENEATTWKDRLETLENNLLEALGDINGTRSSILKDVTKLQRDLEHTLSALDSTQQELSEKEHLLRNRDTLLESTGLESRKLSELLEKERAARRADRNHFDQMQRSQQSLTRTIQQNDTRAMELEQARNIDRRKYTALENQYMGQLTDRNNLLLSLWNRLSTLCGADFMQKNSLVEDSLPSVDVIARNLVGFSRNINLAVRSVEVLVGGFRTRIRDVEKNLFKDFQTLEHAIDVRTKRIDHLEKMVAQQTKERLEAPPASLSPVPPQGEREQRRSVSRSSSRSGHTSRSEEISKLKNENKLLKAELQFARTTSPTKSTHSNRGSIDSNSSMAGVIPGVGSQIPRSPPHLSAIPPRDSSSRASMTATLMRHHSSSAVEHTSTSRESHQAYHAALPGLLESPTRRSSLVMGNNHHQGGGHHTIIPSQPLQPSEQRWIHRLKELERRLKAEREARLLDRSGARKRLEEGRLENEELRRELEREREGRRGSLDEGEEEEVDEEESSGDGARAGAEAGRTESLKGGRRVIVDDDA